MFDVSKVPKTISLRIKTLLDSHGLSRYEFSQITNIPYSTVKRISQPDSTVYPNLENLCMIADAFGLSLDYLIGLTEERKETFDDGLNQLCKLYPLASKEDREVISMLLRKYDEHN